jgi:hypothetical protein
MPRQRLAVGKSSGVSQVKSPSFRVKAIGVQGMSSDWTSPISKMAI